MHQRLRQVAAQLPLADVILLGVEARRPARRSVALEPSVHPDRVAAFKAASAAAKPQSRNAPAASPSHRRPGGDAPRRPCQHAGRSVLRDRRSRSPAGGRVPGSPDNPAPRTRPQRAHVPDSGITRGNHRHPDQDRRRRHRGLRRRQSGGDVRTPSTAGHHAARGVAGWRGQRPCSASPGCRPRTRPPRHGRLAAPFGDVRLKWVVVAGPAGRRAPVGRVRPRCAGRRGRRRRPG